MSAHRGPAFQTRWQRIYDFPDVQDYNTQRAVCTFTISAKSGQLRTLTTVLVLDREVAPTAILPATDARGRGDVQARPAVSEGPEVRAQQRVRS